MQITKEQLKEYRGLLWAKNFPTDVPNANATQVAKTFPGEINPKKVYDRMNNDNASVELSQEGENYFIYYLDDTTQLATNIYKLEKKDFEQLKKIKEEKAKNDSKFKLPQPKDSYLALISRHPCLTASLSISTAFISAWIVFLIFQKLNNKYPEWADNLMAPTNNKMKQAMGWLMKNANRFTRHWALYLIGLVGVNGLAALVDWGIRRYKTKEFIVEE